MWECTGRSATSCSRYSRRAPPTELGVSFSFKGDRYQLSFPTTREFEPVTEPERDSAFDPRDIAEAPDVLSNGQPRPAPTEREDSPLLVFSAAQQDQTAKESPPSDTMTPLHSIDDSDPPHARGARGSWSTASARDAVGLHRLPTTLTSLAGQADAWGSTTRRRLEF